MLPIHGLQRREKFMNAYVGGISTNRMNDGPQLNRGLEPLGMLKKDVPAWRRKTCTSCSGCGNCAAGCGPRSRSPTTRCSAGKRACQRNDYRGGHMKLDHQNWHCFTLSRYDRDRGKWALQKAPVYQIID